MPTSRTRGAVSIAPSAGLLSLFVFLVAATSIAFATTPSARVDNASRISVTAVAGDVDVTMAGNTTAVQPESTVSLPARVVTGSDGMLGLTQAGTNITVAGDTDIEIPAEAVDGNLVARLVQHRGNVFYDVAHRDVGKLRVETPYLVAVIKGTQFNVAVQEDGTTISLFEGQLEIRTPDGSDIIQLNAGEIAIRSRVDGAIRVIGMNEERVEAPRAAGRARDDAVAAVRAVQAPGAVRLVEDSARVSAGTATSVAARAQPASPAADLTKDAALGARPAVQIASGLDLATDRTGVDTRANLDLGAANIAVGVDAAVNLGAGAVDLGVNAGASLGGAVTADIGLGTTLDLGGGTAAVSLDSNLSLGGVTADAGLGAGIDLGGGSVDVGLDTGVDLGATAGVDLGADAGLNLGSGTVSVGLDTGIDLGGASVVDVGLDTSVDLSGGTLAVAADLGVASLDVGVDTGGGLDLGVDLGPVDDVVAPVVAPIVPALAPIVAPVLGGADGGGLLGGLLGGRRP